MNDLNEMLEQIKSELFMLNNKGAIALPEYFRELGIQAVPGDQNACVLAVHLLNLFPGVDFSVFPHGEKSTETCSQLEVYSHGIPDSGVPDIEVNIPKDMDIAKFACDFDNHKYEFLVVEIDPEDWELEFDDEFPC